MQGFLFSRPLPLNELERLLQTSCRGRGSATASAA
jgi:EAL domain-containing protein (putative c-di-GMP-specific phosphodiesterase class I)